MANALRNRGFRPGDRLAVQLANCVELIDLYLACLQLGVIFVPVNVLYREREVAHILHDAAPRFFVCRDNLAELMAEAGADARRLRRRRLDGDSAAALVYTSGTTGAAKGAILTHNNFAANAVNLLACWQITAADRFLLALPLFHVHALGNGLHCWLLSGCRMRLLERFEHQRPRRVSGFPADAVLRRADHLYAAAGDRAGDRARDRAEHAAVRLAARRRCLRRCWRIFARCSAIPFWNATG